jgi:hypothetical protein
MSLVLLSLDNSIVVPAVTVIYVTVTLIHFIVCCYSEYPLLIVLY